MPKVSVVIPVYNVEPYLRECIDSVINQTLRDIEIILVDDGSTDGSPGICRSYAEADPRIRVITQPNSGVAAARKAGAAAARSPFLGFVDADDYIEPDMYEAMLESIGDCDLLTSACYRDAGPGKVFVDRIAVGIYQTPEQMKYITDNMIMVGVSNERGISAACYSKLYRTSIANEAMRDTDLTLFFHEDAEFIFRYLLICGSVRVTDLCKYHYRTRRDSVSFTGRDDYLQNLHNFYAALCGVFKKHPDHERLMEQLKHYIVLLLTYTLHQRLGLPPHAGFIRYVNPLANELAGKKIALYGAGAVGQSYYMHMLRSQLREPAVWVDKNHENYREHFPVKPVAELHTADFDCIVIAVKSGETAKSIVDELTAAGIPKEKLLWNAPIRIY